MDAITKTKPLAKRPPPYEIFFLRLNVILDPTELENVRTAYLCSKFGHHKQTRIDGSRYFDHPKAAAWIYVDELGGSDVRVLIDTLLHDVREETYLLSPYRIKLNFGDEIAHDVEGLTKLRYAKESTGEYLGRVIRRGPWAILAKLLDRLHNLRTLLSCSPEMRDAQVKETREYHIPMLIPALRACGGEWVMIADTVESLIKQAIESYS